MKRILIPLVIFAAMLAGDARAQPAGSGEAFETEVTRRAKETALELREQKANEIKIGDFTYSGILIEALKADNFLQLFNPFAPLEYGSPEDNVVRDPIGGSVIGLKLFSFQF